VSIYATLWILRFPAFGDAYPGCAWVSVLGQGVPAHIGTPTEGCDYESGDPYAGFLPPAIPVVDDDSGELRAVVIVREHTEKVGQEYIGPLVVLSGAGYATMPFQTLHDHICDALRGSRPRLIADITMEGERRLLFEDGSSEEAP
jgi:hypothetical protein